MRSKKGDLKEDKIGRSSGSGTASRYESMPPSRPRSAGTHNCELKSKDVMKNCKIKSECVSATLLLNNRSSSGLVSEAMLGPADAKTERSKNDI